MKYMKRIFTLLVVATFVAGSVFGAVPKNYYSTLNGKSGQALKNAIHQLTKKHTVLTYGSLWYHFPSTDCYPDDKGRVWDMYSDYNYRFNSRLGYSTSGMNKEHSLPKSWWGGTEVDAYTDINHLYPSDGDANTAKLHWPLGTVSSASFNNGVTKVGTPVTGQGGGAATVFEPDDRYKGDFARTYFYMASCYQDYTWKYTWMMSNTSWLTLNSWSIQLLLQWHRQDPVSQKEIDRNEAVYRIQNNRNPFIDNPDLVEYIWGEKAGKTFVIDGGDITGDPVLVTPTQGTELTFGEIGLGKSLQYVVYVKGDNLLSDLRIMLYKDDYRMFSIPVDRIERAIAVSEEGYPLTITYTPTEVGDHKAKLLILDGGITGSVGIELTASCKDVPVLNPVQILSPTDVEGGSYTINWRSTSDEIDGYVICRTIYDSNGDIEDFDETFADTEETSCTFNDLQPGYTHACTVQSRRLGYLSEKSEVVNVNISGVDGISVDKPVSLLPVEGGMLVKCSEPLPGACIYNANGQLVQQYPVLEDDTMIYLPGGVYVLTISGNIKPVKVVIR